MNYELALELNKAGFPQCEDESGPMCAAHGCWRAGGTYGYVNCHNPTLGELVMKCGEGFQVLKRGGHLTWLAYMNGGKWIEGETAEIAVARLWLVLNKPKS